jgi:hypothetical protein
MEQGDHTPDINSFWIQHLLNFIQYDIAIIWTTYITHYVHSLMRTWFVYRSSFCWISPIEEEALRLPTDEEIETVQYGIELFDFAMRSITMQQQYLRPRLDQKVNAVWMAYVSQPPLLNFLRSGSSFLPKENTLMRLELILSQTIHDVFAGEWLMMKLHPNNNSPASLIGKCCIHMVQHCIDRVKRQLGNLTSRAAHDLFLGELIIGLYRRIFFCFVTHRPEQSDSLDVLINKLDKFQVYWKEMEDQVDTTSEVSAIDQILCLQTQLEIELLVTSISLTTLLGVGKFTTLTSHAVQVQQMACNNASFKGNFPPLQVFASSYPEYHKYISKFYSTWCTNRGFVAAVSVLAYTASSPEYSSSKGDLKNTGADLLRVFIFWFRASLQLFQLHIEDLTYDPTPIGIAVQQQTKHKLPFQSPLQEMIDQAMNVFTFCRPHIKRCLVGNEKNVLVTEIVPSQYLTRDLRELLDDHEKNRDCCEQMFASL